MSSVMWLPLVIGEGAQKLVLRVATQADVAMLDAGVRRFGDDVCLVHRLERNAWRSG